MKKPTTHEREDEMSATKECPKCGRRVVKTWSGLQFCVAGCGVIKEPK